MRLITEPEGISGKTIQRAVLARHRTFLLVFTDGTYLVCGATVSYDSPELEFDEDLEDYLKVRCNLMTQAEYDAEVKARDEREKAEAERRRRAEYERLKAIYEPQGS